MEDAALLELAARQHGVVSDTQASELGYSTRTVRRRVQSGEWSRPLPGVLRCTGAPPTAHQAAMAAALWAGPDAVVSHTTAGWLWGLDGVRAGEVEITVGPRRGLRSEGIVVHRSYRAPEPRVVGGIPLTSPTRTLFDLAGSLALGPLELAMEDAFRRGLSDPGQLERLFAAFERDRRSGARHLRVLLGARSGRANTGSGGEVLLEQLLRRSGLPTPTRQHPVDHSGRRIYVDFAYPEQRLAIEFDSVRWHTGREKLENDAERRNLLCAENWELVTVTYTMVKSRPLVTMRVISDAYRDCCAKTAKGWPDPHNSRDGR